LPGLSFLFTAKGVGLAKKSALDVTVQVLTAPSLVRRMDAQLGDGGTATQLLGILGASLCEARLTPRAFVRPLDALANQKVPALKAVAVKAVMATATAVLANPIMRHRRYTRLVTDVKYVARTGDCARRLLSSRDGRSSLLHVLQCGEGLDPMARVPSHEPHVAMEDGASWVAAWSLAMVGPPGGNRRDCGFVLCLLRLTPALFGCAFFISLCAARV